MDSQTWHLAQVNVAKAVGSRESVEMKTFIDLLDEVNAAADAAPGFVWRWDEAYEETGNDALVGQMLLALRLVFLIRTTPRPSVWHGLSESTTLGYRQPT